MNGQQIYIQRKVPAAGIPAPSRLRSYAHAALGDTRGELTLRIVDEAESAELNGRFRGKPGRKGEEENRAENGDGVHVHSLTGTSFEASRSWDSGTESRYRPPVAEPSAT